MGVALEPDFILDFPEVPKDLEATPAKRKLIPPVTQTHLKREQIARNLHRKSSPSTDISTSSSIKEKPQSLTFEDIICKFMVPFFNRLQQVERFFCKLVLG